MINDLGYFEIEKNRIITGEKIVGHIYDAALESSEHHAELMLPVHQMSHPIKVFKPTVRKKK
jgi:hypothetical protein